MNRSFDKIAASTGEVLQASGEAKLSQYRKYLSTVKNTVFYFGFKPEQSQEMFEHYVLEMFPLFVYLGALGLLVLAVKVGRRFPKKYLVYLLVWGLSGAILVYYYGSWKFNDNPNPDSYTIGNSYTRYWLPIYLMLLPFVAYAIDSVARAISLTGAKDPWHPSRVRSLTGDGLRVAATLGLAAISIIFVLFGSEEGLAYTYHTNLAERRVAEQVFSLTEDNSIIITQYYDKFFFPDRRVIVGRLPNDEILAAAVDLARHYPLYYYNFYLDADDVSYLNSRKFAPYNLKMSLIKKMNASFGLYRLEALEE
jgi:phosphate starvation-inducible membrane PsiE